ncbi:MAG: phage portal protein [Pseudodesulfovibrio sp.]|uniref:Phage portal protein, PBSX family n=1 Tax=Pseudodesulfovibrio aespoeensis (strain ATCC 700646 / DSM 10631 / Aspo-2) TaxID=643562 RepID=E6VXL0_PSEA9|nr:MULTISPECIES: phage portal protein [Pseudodesulfovibrio]MBU4190806.1 phage portal protein [Pseudomonadota bacterium]ADU61468.1 phage portal protein, PBSX family [Pseudodesulfovibrio aespoeensis Aspo-2]MBU4380365.1 phage portal protein [Pseudomonadota bacterium]MBU4475233.1 phage portal protein [Pseudomonadota bacterium]MBU4516272.1 phage portal protein [Pseudomonadota bacterium]
MSEPLLFTFGDPEPVLSGIIYDYLGTWLTDNGTYYAPPVPFKGLARLLRANAYHGPAIEFKVNQVMRGFKASRAVSRRTMHAGCTDFHVFYNAFFLKVRNHFGEVVGLRQLPSINMRRAKATGVYCLLLETGKVVTFEPDEVLHVKNYDVCQEIYGLPGYLGAIQSMLLNEDATLFRRKYYKNGAHMGYIFYAGGQLDPETQTAIKERIQGTKGIGNFRSMFIHIPNGKEKEIQIIPVGDFSTKDELEKIKNLSRDDIIAAHRIPPAMACLIPQNTGGFGDITKIDEVYQRNEVKPVQELLMESINEVLLPRDWVTFDTGSESSPM